MSNELRHAYQHFFDFVKQVDTEFLSDQRFDDQIIGKKTFLWNSSKTWIADWAA